MRLVHRFMFSLLLSTTTISDNSTVNLKTTNSKSVPNNPESNISSRSTSHVTEPTVPEKKKNNMGIVIGVLAIVALMALTAVVVYDRVKYNKEMKERDKFEYTDEFGKKRIRYRDDDTKWDIESLSDAIVLPNDAKDVVAVDKLHMALTTPESTLDSHSVTSGVTTADDMLTAQSVPSSPPSLNVKHTLSSSSFTP